MSELILWISIFFSDFRQPYISKTADRRVQRTKFWVLKYTLYAVYFKRRVFKVILKSFGAFPIFRFSTTLYLENCWL